MISRLIPLALASILMAAHFLRGGSLELALVSILVPFLLLIRKMWSLIVVQLSAYAAAAIWLFTTADVIRDRMMVATPWTLSAIILGSVALFTMFAGLLLNSPRVKEKYSRR
jgi:hypothetical protein